MKEYGRAVELIRNGLQYFPDNASLRGHNAICYHRLGDYTSSEKEWNLVVQLRPDSVMAVANLAYVLMLQNRDEDARPWVERLYKLDAKDYRYGLLAGELHLRENQLQKAIPFFEGVIKQDSSNIMALTRLAIIHHRSGNMEKSSEYIQIAEKNMHHHPQCWRGLSDAYRSLGDIKKLIEVLEWGTRVDIGSAAPWIVLALEYRRQGLIDESIRAWLRSFELRGYVKIHCSICDEYFSIPYHLNMRFNPNRRQTCPYCVGDVPMPDGLAVV
jgi:tetratricopeptide (TPR) repeat protein